MPHETEWEKEFDENFEPHEHWQGDKWVTEKVKSFIKSLLQKEREQVTKEVWKLLDDPIYKFKDEVHCTCLLHFKDDFRDYAKAHNINL